jgi:hypothetical protein
LWVAGGFPACLVASSLGGIAEHISSMLDSAGYTERRWFGINARGLAVITRLEQVEADGTPKRDRWSPEFPDAGSLRVLEYLKETFIPISGYYRVFIFAATDLAFTQGGDEPTLEMVSRWMGSGSASIPEEWGDLPIRPRLSFGAYLYEFSSRSSDVAPGFIGSDRARTTAADHLRKTGVFTLLAQGAPHG